MPRSISSPPDGRDDQQVAVLLDTALIPAVAVDSVQTLSKAKTVLAIDDRSPWATTLLNDGLFSAEQAVCIDGKTFIFGQVLKNSRLHVVALVDSGNGRFIPRLFYKSLSQGSWRCSPYITRGQEKRGKPHDLLSKGEEVRGFSYTQTTRVTRELALALDAQEQKGNHRKIQGGDLDKYFHEDNFDDLFNDPDFKFNKVLTFSEETSAFDFKEHGFDEDPFAECRGIDKLVREGEKKTQKKEGYLDKQIRYGELSSKYRDNKEKLKEVVMEMAGDTAPGLPIHYYDMYKDEPYAGKILEKAIRATIALDPELVIEKFRLYKDQLYARKMLKRAIEAAIYIDPELIFTYYEVYVEELDSDEITDRVLRKLAREKPDVFFKYCGWSEVMPDHDALVDQALRLLLVKKGSNAWDYFKYYADRPFAYKILKAKIEEDSFNVIQHFPLYKDQPYADEILQEALAQNPKAAVEFFEKYQDRPYAQKVFRSASRKHPGVLLCDLFHRHYCPKSSSEEKKLERLVRATLKCEPGLVLWCYRMFLDKPYRDEVLEKAAFGAAEKNPEGFFERFEDCIIDKPYADEVLEKALRTASEKCPRIAVEESHLYEAKPYYDEIFSACVAKLAENNSSKEETPEEAMANLADVEKSAPGIVPEFMQENIVKVYSGIHEKVGKYTVEVYEAECNGQKFEWEMAYDKRGRVWIEGINVVGCPVNTFGIRSQFINSGILTKKPFDYHDNNRGLTKGKGKRYHDKDYDDVTPFLDLLPPIKKFRQQRGISRQKSIQRRSERIKAVVGS